jgi:hypothetical protein
MPFGAWILLCVVSGAALAKRPAAALGLSVAGFVAVPFADQTLVRVPAVPYLHPFAWFLLACTVASAITRLIEEHIARPSADEKSQRVFIRIPGAPLVLLVLAAAAMMYQAQSYHDQGTKLLMNQILVPLLAYSLLRDAVHRDQEAPRKVAVAVVCIGCSEAVVTVIMKLHIIPQLYSTAYSSAYYWYPPQGRALGTTDHPEVLAFLMMVCIALVPNLRSVRRQAIALLLLFGTLALTAERVPLLLALMIALFSVFRRREVSSRTRRGIALCVAIGIPAIYFSNLLSLLLSRVGNDDGSAAARSIAWRVGLGVLPHYLFSGGGLAHSTQVASSLITTSFESPFIVYSIAYGALFTAVVFLCQANLAFGGARYNRTVEGSAVACLSALAYAQLFSSVATESLVGPLIGVVLALSSSRWRRLAHVHYSLSLEEIPFGAYGK